MYVNTRQGWHHYRVFERCHQGVARGMDGGKFKGNYLRLMPGLCLEDNERIMEYTFIPTGIKREMVRPGVDCDWKG